MKDECSIVRDLLPLYAEKMVRPATASFVERHLAGCAGCRAELEKEKVPPPPAETDTAPLRALRRKLRAWKVRTVLMTAFLAAALLLSAFAVLDAPDYRPYAEGLLTAAENAGGSVTLTFADGVTGYRCTPVPDETGAERYSIEAWTSIWDGWFAGEGVRSVTLYPSGDKPLALYYSSNNGEPDVCVYGQPDGEQSIPLPRLALGYYLLAAAAALLLLGAARFLVRKREGARTALERAMLYPLSYIIRHFAVTGLSTASYSMPRDFFLILFVSFLLYSGLLLAHSLWRNRKERHQVNN